MTTTSYIVTEQGFAFRSARDAIDAISAFEESTFDDWEYRIEARAGGWFASVNQIDGEVALRGALTPPEVAAQRASTTRVYLSCNLAPDHARRAIRWLNDRGILATYDATFASFGGPVTRHGEAWTRKAFENALRETRTPR